MASGARSIGLLAQASVVSAGRRASAIRRTRAAVAEGRPAVSSSAGSGQSRTASRSISRRPSNRARPNCGWPSSAPTAAQLSASRWRSSPGRTTAPAGRAATVASRSAVAGMLPVEPAAIHRVARRCLFPIAPQPLKQQVARAAGSISPFSARIAGQFSVTILGSRESAASAPTVRRAPDPPGGRRTAARSGPGRAIAPAPERAGTACSTEASCARSMISRASISCRFISGIAGGASKQRRALRRQILAGRKGEFVLVDIADRAHARQQQGGAAAQPEERLAQGAAGAAGRQQNQDRREPLRRTAEPVEQAAGQGGDEIPMRRNGVDAGSGPAASRSRSPAGSGRGAVSCH